MRFFSNMHVGSVTCQKSHVNMQKNTCQHAAPFPDVVPGLQRLDLAATEGKGAGREGERR